MHSEDFPALPGGPAGPGVVGSREMGNVIGRTPSSSLQGGIFKPSPTAPGDHSDFPLPSSSISSHLSFGRHEKDDLGKDPKLKPDRYGLLGLLNVIRMNEQDVNTLSIGSDLTTLGLNLNSSE